MSGKMPDGIAYYYWRCTKCGEEVLGMKELHEVAERYRKMRTYSAKLTKWGLSLGLRIPAELVRKYKLKNKEELKLVPEEKGFRVVM
jgi:hypothetical protein